ncbi:MAG: asparagine synthase (glutamine-hydrolyzing), partial [Candidatus Gribaldobacteria bacterium]|nr:asparagine synthase (glutamine-hydrolyzing) [Candidatus Gribaldobacteria bacterium]
MNDTLKHRGPDDEGFFLNQDKSVGLAQKRLSILDLSSLGRQPMQAEHCWVTFNGEVYNFDEIRSELKGCGYSFLGGSDTEVILKSYLKWGIESIKRFRGMFAFSLWDEKLQKMFLVRDRAGIKPLYYYWDGQLLVFASELKAILQHPEVKKELNLEALSLFLQMGCVPAPYSIFQNISKLEAGHYLVFDKLQGVQKQKYWDVANYYLEKNETPSLLEAQERLEEILLESFKLRMVSDVEVGMFLSGGIDSSTVASLLTKKLGFSNLKTFTIGFEEKGYNEAEYAKKIAQHLGTDHHELYCATKDAVDVIPQLSEIYDEPFGDSSAIPTYLLAKFARSLVKVSLSADGGDETFAGYDRYWAIDKIYKQFQLYPKGVLKMGAKVFRGLPFNKIFNIYQGLVGVSTGATKLSKQLGKLQRKADRLDNLMAHPQEIVSFYQLLGYGFWKYHEVKELLIEGKATDVFNY